MHLINKWVVSNAFESIPTSVYDLLKCIDLKELSDNQIKSITDQVNKWPLSEEQFHMFSEMVSEAKKERDEIQEAKRFKPENRRSHRARRIFLPSLNGGGFIINANMHFQDFGDLFNAMAQE